MAGSNHISRRDFITLTTADRVIVKEAVDEVVRRAIDHARAVRFVPGLAR